MLMTESDISLVPWGNATARTERRSPPATRDEHRCFSSETSSSPPASATCARAMRSPASSSACACSPTEAWRRRSSTASPCAWATSWMSAPRCRCGPSAAAPTRSRSSGRATGVRWQLEEPGIVTVPFPGGLPDGIHEVSVELRLRMSYIPIEHQPSVFRASQAHHADVRAGRRTVPVRRLALQLHARLRHGARPRDGARRGRGCRCHRRRDPRRGARRELPGAVDGVDRRLVRAAREVLARAHELRLVDRHPAASGRAA